MITLQSRRKHIVIDIGDIAQPRRWSNRDINVVVVFDDHFSIRFHRRLVAGLDLRDGF